MSALGFALDLGRCTGCQACELACTTENGLSWGTSWRRVYTFNEARDPRAARHHLSIACNHCQDAPCEEACPARAFIREPETGILTLRPERCIGCRYCSWACPFEAPLADDAAGVMGKCTLCPERLERGERPACVEACPTDALRLATLEDGAAADGAGLVDDVPGFPKTNARPSMRFRPARRGEAPPESTWELDRELLASFEASRPRQPNAGSLRREWPLLVFTLAAALVVAMGTAAQVGAGLARGPIAAAAAVAALISMQHLGRRSRAWRAFLGIGRSWLGREVALYGAFVALLTARATESLWVPDGTWLATDAGRATLGWGAVATGWMALFAADRVYDPVRRPRALGLHSSDALLIAVTLTALFAGPGWLALAILGLRLVIYLARKSRLRREGRPSRPLLSILRVAAGVFAPATALALDPPSSETLLVAGLTLGELIDRTEFYVELEPTTPRGTIADDLWKRLR